MGQAKHRGTLEQRKEQAIARKALESEQIQIAADAARERVSKMSEPERKELEKSGRRRIGNVGLVAALALALHGK